MNLVLYGTVGCHLCEAAESLLAEILGPEAFGSVCRVDIAADDELQDRYGLRIPVLADTVSGRELNWPFDAGDLSSWLESGYTSGTGEAEERKQ